MIQGIYGSRNTFRQFKIYIIVKEYYEFYNLKIITEFIKYLWKYLLNYVIKTSFFKEKYIFQIKYFWIQIYILDFTIWDV